MYGDYDVDGTTSVAMMYSFIRRYHAEVDYYIPDRYTEGYGVSLLGVDYAIHHRVSLIIALDCGIKSVEKVAYASENHVDFIICDHHTPGDMLPAAVAVLDPEGPDGGYPLSIFQVAVLASNSYRHMRRAMVSRLMTSRYTLICWL